MAKFFLCALFGATEVTGTLHVGQVEQTLFLPCAAKRSNCLSRRGKYEVEVSTLPVFCGWCLVSVMQWETGLDRIVFYEFQL